MLVVDVRCVLHREGGVSTVFYKLWCMCVCLSECFWEQCVWFPVTIVMEKEKRQDHIPSIFPDICPDPKNRAVFLIRRRRRRATERETGGISGSELKLIERRVLPDDYADEYLFIFVLSETFFGNKRRSVTSKCLAYLILIQSQTTKTCYCRIIFCVTATFFALFLSFVYTIRVIDQQKILPVTFVLCCRSFEVTL